ncbi:tRNA pseudouridine(55) synthase TruB [Porphyrobacter sp. SLTP]|uniref:tRNA pseudouridine(55) synthase TruB n=1 Tax=Porphyrobacter sp. SLTP TaxID=2683266 RepID=UPI00141320A9|nr:tRNA pseudouridine(55) synthase TruB [Porphyrobacter sp. SLTP]NBB25833.1 tRNA pseudouridine(55) synthase TruB [Porphyrobacter sp. SLTP]
MTAPLSGWLILDKPKGMGSTQGVSAVKRVLRQNGYAKTKVGHGGTLDPLAEGVLPIALGEATKLAGRMLDSDKIYIFTVQFGAETSTLDTEGEIVAESDVRPTLAEVEAVLPRFTGPIEQVPPAYSALKVGGQRAYDLARAGEVVELTARAVTIHSLSVRAELVEAPHFTSEVEDGPSTCSGRTGLDEITLTAQVSKGTYIRSLARDIAYALGTCGHVTYLCRTKAGPFTQSQAISLDLLEETAKGRGLEHLLLPLEAGLDDIPALHLDQTSAQAVRQGRVLSDMPQSSGLYLAKLGCVPVALMEISDGTATVVRGFNLPDVAE